MKTLLEKHGYAKTLGAIALCGGIGVLMVLAWRLPDILAVL